MCEASICKCHCAMPSASAAKVTIKLERDKKYVTGRGEVITIVATGLTFLQGKSCIGVKGVTGPVIGPHNQCVHYKENGTGPVLKDDHIVKEYKEPLVTKRDVVLYGTTEANKSYAPNHRHVWSGEVGGGLYKGNAVYWREISRQTVTFTEEVK